MSSTDKMPDFEKRLAELEALVERLEDGELPLEESLQVFERGVRLTRECQQALSAAEQRVQALIESDAGLEATAITDEADDADK